MSIDTSDQLYVVDKTGRIQVFSADGQFVRGWRTPEIEQGKPCGLRIGQDGNVLVADTHYFRVLTYSPLGELLADRTLGGVNGSRPGEFHFVTDVVRDTAGCYYVAEYGDFDRIQKLDSRGKFLLQWGGHGSRPGQFVQPRGLAIDQHNHIWVADACNHRIQEFDASGERAKLLQVWGQHGARPGELKYPFSLALDRQGHVFVADRGNCRVQKFTLQGRYLGHWGTPGRREGELNEPWEVVRDSQGRVYVLDTNNHRVQRIRL